MSRYNSELDSNVEASSYEMWTSEYKYGATSKGALYFGAYFPIVSALQ